MHGSGWMLTGFDGTEALIAQWKKRVGLADGSGRGS